MCVKLRGLPFVFVFVKRKKVTTNLKKLNLTEAMPRHVTHRKRHLRLLILNLGAMDCKFLVSLKIPRSLRKVHVAFLSSTFHKTCDHNDAGALLLPNHPPKIRRCALHWSLAEDEMASRCRRDRNNDVVSVNIIPIVGRLELHPRRITGTNVGVPENNVLILDLVKDGCKAKFS